jgi:phasin family protein
MTEQFKVPDFSEFGQVGFDTYGRSFGELNKGFQAIAAEWTDYSKRAFEDSTKAFEKLVGAKSTEKAFEIQSEFAKKAFEDYVAELTKLSEMYASLAQSVFKVR